jgi:hypothetical protein
MCQGIFRFPNQNSSWHGQESANKKSGSNSQLVCFQYVENAGKNLSWHFSPKAGQVEIRKSEIGHFGALVRWTRTGDESGGRPAPGHIHKSCNSL